jgi:hypothetical protein
MGPASDSANYQKIAGATVIWTSFEGKELARAVTAADGSYTLGSFKPGRIHAQRDAAVGWTVQGNRVGIHY